jgi:hypothetical protein
MPALRAARQPSRRTAQGGGAREKSRKHGAIRLNTGSVSDCGGVYHDLRANIRAVRTIYGFINRWVESDHTRKCLLSFSPCA